MKIAIVGCGFVADYYAATLPNHPELSLVGVTDRDHSRAERFAAHWHVPTVYPSTEALLKDPQVELVLNLTNPHSHFEVSKACLEAGRHVYSEKPLATDFARAEELVALAKERNLSLSSAPCNALGESAQTAWKALRSGAIGRVRLAYAELDDGLIHRMRFRKWISPSGAPWPFEDEFKVGCTLEHAGYYVTWLALFFGPARAVTSFASVQVPDKLPDNNGPWAPDFAVACIEYAGGEVARLTCSIVAPHDHQLRIFGDEGILSVDECWNYGASVKVKRRSGVSMWAEKYPALGLLPGIRPRTYPLVRKSDFRFRYDATHAMDFSRGVAEQAAGIVEGRDPRLSSAFSLHVNEIVLAMQNPEEMGHHRRLTTTFAPPSPMPWAQ